MAARIIPLDRHDHMQEQIAVHAYGTHGMSNLYLCTQNLPQKGQLASSTSDTNWRCLQTKSRPFLSCCCGTNGACVNGIKWVLCRRRLVKRIYIPMPDADARLQLLEHLLRGQPVNLRRGDKERIVAVTETYSASDLAALCREAAIIPIRYVLL